MPRAVLDALRHPQALRPDRRARRRRSRPAPGEVHALIGENGAGKSTLMNVLAGALRADAGTMTLDGAPYAPASPLDARRRGVALIHQELSLCAHLTVAENILMGLEPARAAAGSIAPAMARETARGARERFIIPSCAPIARVGPADRGAPGRRDLPRDGGARVDRADGRADQQPAARRRRAPVRADPPAARRGVAIVYISHFLEEVREIADRFTVLRDGRSVATGELARRDQRSPHRAHGRPADGRALPRTRARRRARTSRSTCGPGRRRRSCARRR